MSTRPPVWQMIRDGINHVGSPTTLAAIRDCIIEKYDDVNANTINTQFKVCTVNSPSRVYHQVNENPRRCSGNYDFLFSTGRGTVALYDPSVHGEWEIRRNESGRLVVAQIGDDLDAPCEIDAEEQGTSTFALESHLRDFLERNIETVQINGGSLKLFNDAAGRTGIEYPTDVGPIDILAVDTAGNFVIIELKVSKGADRALGQALRYMGWVARHLAAGKKVTGIIVACDIDEKLRYAASVTPNISLLEYKLGFELSPAILS